MEDRWGGTYFKIAVKIENPKCEMNPSTFIQLVAVYLCFPDGVTLLVFKFGQQLGSHWAYFVFFGLLAFSWRGAIAGQIGGLNRAQITVICLYIFCGELFIQAF